ncbi:class I SAM-dependent methyltransferase [Luteimicrobium subarcticum]|uniref:Methyltransferase family protein n=1 Tax=Luteimicrobium subarcticum TaxID=620910 RepID=A0A2M8WQV1_9MICO|nr:class I SAM-dependent methyltransferase [Luteimicrobium subarcticum]PJI93319.1 methyltransferase family protein [Luteimicrobium subarcticum]
MSLYGRVFAALYDRSVASAEDRGMRERRRTVLADAHGRVLELGAGTGLNLPLYPAGLDTLTLTEPEEPMLRRLRDRAAEVGPPADGRPLDIVRAPAERLPFDDASFDTVVSTLTLCTVDDLPAALAETRRVLAPGGRLLLVEHVRSPDERTARWQDRLHGPWKAFAHGCHANLDTPAALRSAGFDASGLRDEVWVGGPFPVRPLVVGAASPS